MLVHPELVEVFAALPERYGDPYADIEATRTKYREAMGAVAALPDERFTAELIGIPGGDGNAIPVQLLRPSSCTGVLPAVVYMHGGGFAFGELDGPGLTARKICTESRAIVLDVQYRLAPEYPFPAGVEDCYSVLAWLGDKADELGIDPGRVAVAGGSAGACLAAALALMARDREGPPLMYQCLLVPCIDDRTNNPVASRITDNRIVHGSTIQRTWETYLGPQARDTISPYASPARATDLSGLPPAYVLTCGLDPLCDEGLDYGQRLALAGVAVETLHVPGAWHGFESYAPNSDLAKRTTSHWLAALRAALSRELPDPEAQALVWIA